MHTVSFLNQHTRKLQVQELANGHVAASFRKRNDDAVNFVVLDNPFQIRGRADDAWVYQGFADVFALFIEETQNLDSEFRPGKNVAGQTYACRSGSHDKHLFRIT